MDSEISEAGSLIAIGIGQAGCELAASYWEIVCRDHGIDPHSGASPEGATGHWERSFTVIGAGSPDERYVPRSLFIDPDPRGCDELRRKWRELFNPASFVNGDENSANNYAIGYYERSSQLSSEIRRILERMLIKGPFPSGFLVFHSYGGGTGSGLTTRVLKILEELAPGQPRVSIGVLPSESVSASVTEPYNAIFGLAGIFENATLGLIFSNDHIHRLLTKYWGSKDATMEQVNWLISEIVSAVTGPIRFDGADDVGAQDLANLTSDLAPHPDFKLVTGSIFPIENLLRKKSGIRTAGDIFTGVLENYRGDCPGLEGTIISLGLFGSGRSNRHDLTGLDRSADPVDSDAADFDAPRFLRMHLSAEPSPHSSVSVLLNSSAIGQQFDGLIERFDQLWNRKAFLTSYHDAGMSDNEIAELRREVGFRIGRYEDL